MKYLIIYTHPNPKSFNHAIKEKIETKLKNEGNEVEIRDLYALGFDPVLKGADFVAFKAGKTPDDIKREQDHIKSSDTIIFIHPIWWFGQPATLKGYIDRVFSYGFAYISDKGILKGLLTDKKAVIINTTGGTEDDYRNNGYKDALAKTMDIGIFSLCGIKVILHKFFHAVPAVSNDEREKMLLELDSISFE
ncbi:MAG: NAD(P)H-dependent oxidoreductase [Candidatus Omnitrophota bacterium]